MTRTKSKKITKLLAEMHKLADDLRGADAAAMARAAQLYPMSTASDLLAGDAARNRLAHRLGALDQVARNAANSIDAIARRLADDLRIFAD